VVRIDRLRRRPGPAVLQRQGDLVWISDGLPGSVHDLTAAPQPPGSSPPPPPPRWSGWATRAIRVLAARRPPQHKGRKGLAVDGGRRPWVAWGRQLGRGRRRRQADQPGTERRVLQVVASIRVCSLVAASRPVRLGCRVTQA
jgi:hypothetical protein